MSATNTGSVHIEFPWNHYADGTATRGIDAGKITRVRMRLARAASVKHCTACGAAIAAGEEHYVPDYTGAHAYSIDALCENAVTRAKGARERRRTG